MWVSKVQPFCRQESIVQADSFVFVDQPYHVVWIVFAPKDRRSLLDLPIEKIAAELKHSNGWGLLVIMSDSERIFVGTRQRLEWCNSRAAQVSLRKQNSGGEIIFYMDG